MPDFSHVLMVAFIFFLIAICYASVGFGGGSSYLAILALSSISYVNWPKIALLCNIIVVSGGFIIFHKSGYFSWKKGLPFIITSIPFAFLGGSLPISKEAFQWLLAISLFITGVRLVVFQYGQNSEIRVDTKNSQFTIFGQKTDKRVSSLISYIIGGGIGFFSGLIGIGGGIFLSPVLFLIKWGPAREIAAMASFFILVNSMAGLAGQLMKSPIHLAFFFESPGLLILPVCVFAGGQIGSRLGARSFSAEKIKLITGILIIIVSARLVIKLTL